MDGEELSCANLLYEISTVRLSSNDHPEIGGLISQLSDFKTTCFKVALTPLGIQGLNAMFVSLISTLEFLI